MASIVQKKFVRTALIASHKKFAYKPLIGRNASTLADSFYNEEQKELQNTVKKLIDTEINPHADQWEKDKMFPAHEVFKKFGDQGLLGINKPTEYGGLGLSYKYEMAFGEAMGNIRSTGVVMALGVQTDMATPGLAKFGSDELRKEFLAPAITGDMVACLGVSEPGGGSDVASCKTTAVRKGDDLVINGQKMWITNSLQADWMCLLANTREGKPHANKSLIIVPMDTPGVIKAKKIEKMGMHSSDTGLIYFEDAKVPASNIIGEEGMGFTYQMLQFQVRLHYRK
jgi:citronellyl-CoA dehydrogenase